MTLDPIKHRPAKSWQKVSITVDSRMTDAVAAFLSNLTGTGLEITTMGNGRVPATNTCATEKITGYIPTGLTKPDQHAAQKKIEECRKFIEHICQIFPDSTKPLLQMEIIIEEDWGKKWKSFFTAFHITPSIVIKPSWEEIKKHDQEGNTQKRVIEMDPGLAFGTGHHASTQLALLLLEELFQQKTVKPAKVIDIGTGSGILAMACGLFGAHEILALDSDPDAVETAKQNVARNHLDGTVSVSAREVTSLETGFDIVVANITHDILAELAETLMKLILPDGYLVLSGILKGDQEHSLRQTFTKLGLECIKSRTREEWAALEFQKKAD
jgi:ribosomal protein L11 methyltransferase